MMKRATFFFRDSGIIITEVDDGNDGRSLGFRLCSGGFVVGRDSRRGESREVVINLGDITCVILEDSDDPQTSD